MRNTCMAHSQGGREDLCAACILLREKEDMRAQNAAMREALTDAVDTIHGEFCGREHHHSLCDKPREALNKPNTAGQKLLERVKLLEDVAKAAERFAADYQDPDADSSPSHTDTCIALAKLTGSS